MTQVDGYCSGDEGELRSRGTWGLTKSLFCIKSNGPDHSAQHIFVQPQNIPDVLSSGKDGGHAL